MEEQEGDATGQVIEGNGTGQVIYRKLKIRHLKDLRLVVKNYGINAPFTISVLEGLGHGGSLLPHEWNKVLQSVLTRSQFLTWKADFVDRAETQAVINKESPQMASWSSDKIAGRGK